MICEITLNFVLFSLFLFRFNTRRKAHSNPAHSSGCEVGNQAVMNVYLVLFNEKNIYIITLWKHVIKLFDWMIEIKASPVILRCQGAWMQLWMISLFEPFNELYEVKNEVHDYFGPPWVMQKYHKMLQFPIKMQTNKATHLFCKFYKNSFGIQQQKIS